MDAVAKEVSANVVAIDPKVRAFLGRKQKNLIDG